MPMSISKNSGATTYSIRNFSNLHINGSSALDLIDNNTGTENDATILKVFGPRMQIDLTWTLTDESTSVVSGTGSPVTTSVGQAKYLYDTLWSKGTNQFNDSYTLDIDFGGGVTITHPGHIESLDVVMTSNEPLTLQATLKFAVGTVT